MAKKKNGTAKLSMLAWVLLAVQFVLSSAIVFLIRNIVPIKYLVVAAAILIGLVLIFFVGIYFSSKKNRKAFVGIFVVLSLIVNVLLGMGFAAVNHGFRTLNLVTDAEYQTHVISLIVKKDSKYEELADLDNKTVGIIKDLDSENVSGALTEISDKQKVYLDTVTYDSAIEAALALSNGKVESLLVNEAYRGLMADNIADFDDSTRVIYRYEYKEKLTVENSDLDVTKEAFNIVISGIDTYGPVSTVSRSDVNMIVTVNPSVKEILLTSIPRDYYVKLASFGAYDKLTHAGVFGVEESKTTLEDLFGIDIDYYVKVNFTSLITIVDALDGITVDNPRAFKSFPAGKIQLDGSEALSFSRERYSFSDGDNERVKNQQRVLIGIINKLMSPSVVKNYSDVLDAISGCFVTDMTSKEIQSLIQLQISDMSSWDIEMISVTGTGSTSTVCYAMPGYSLYVMKPNYDSVESAAAQIEAVLNK